MALHEQLNDSLTKERGGRHGGKGHEFQRYWALCHLLKLDIEQDDYLVLLEFIEDVAILNAEDFPSELDLFQLKKKEGSSSKWTKALLTKKPPKNGKSILAKLFESNSIKPEAKGQITFVSNAPVELKLSSDQDSTSMLEFFAAELDEQLKTSIRKSISEELGCGENKIDFSNLKFVRSTLAMDDLENHAFGKVAAYLTEKFPDHSARADVLCKALYSEIKVKATATEDAGTFDDLKKIRGISKSQFSGMLALTLSKKPDGDVINEAISNLASENVPFVQRDSVRKAARRFLVDKADKNNELLVILGKAIDTQFDLLPDNLVTSWEVANWITDQIRNSKLASQFEMLEKDYLLAVILHRINQ